MIQYNPDLSLVNQLVIKEKNETTLALKEVKFPGFYQPAKTEKHTQTDYHTLQLPNGETLDVTSLTVSGFKSGSYNLFINGKLARRDADEDEIEAFVKQQVSKYCSH